MVKISTRTIIDGAKYYVGRDGLEGVVLLGGNEEDRAYLQEELTRQGLTIVALENVQEKGRHYTVHLDQIELQYEAVSNPPQAA